MINGVGDPAEKERLSKYFLSDTYDIVLILDVIEHLDRLAGLHLLEDSKNICSNKIILLTPLKWTENKETFENPKSEYFQNPYVLHKSLWGEKDFLDFEQVKLNFTKKEAKKGGYFLGVYTKN